MQLDNARAACEPVLPILLRAQHAHTGRWGHLALTLAHHSQPRRSHGRRPRPILWMLPGRLRLRTDRCISDGLSAPVRRAATVLEEARALGARGRRCGASRLGGRNADTDLCNDLRSTLRTPTLTRYEVENELHYVEGIHNVLHNTFGMKLLHIGVMKCFITRFIT